MGTDRNKVRGNSRQWVKKVKDMIRWVDYMCIIICTLGAVLFIRYVIVTAFLTFFNVTDVIKDRITGYLLPFVAYITLFLAFGIVIFHSVEKEYFVILKWATLGFSFLQVVVLVALYVLRFLPIYEYRQFPFLPVSITDGYVHSGFQASSPGDQSSGPSAPDQLSGEGYSSEFLPKLTKSPGGTFPTSATSRGTGNPGGMPDKGGASSEVSRGGLGESGSELVELDFTHPVPTAPPNKWLAEVYTLIALIVMTVVSLVYLVLLLIYVRQLIYEDSGHVFGHAQSVTRNVAFYVQPQFAQSGNSDNKLANSPTSALQGKPLHSFPNQQQRANCTQSVSNTQIPSEFLPQPQQPGQQRQQLIGNNLKAGNCVDPTQSQQHSKDASHHSSTQSQHSNQSQNHSQQRSPVPPAREMQQNIQSQQQQQVITIYPQKGGGFTSSSSSPRMQVKFAKPLEQEPNPGILSQSHLHGGEAGPPLEPTRSCLVNPGNVQPCNVPPHMMPPQLSQCQQGYDPGNNINYPPCDQYQHQPLQHHPGLPPPIPPHQGQLGGYLQQQGPHATHIQGKPCPPYAPSQQQQQPLSHQPPQLMPYHGKSRAQQQSYNDMVDNSSYLVFSGNPNTSNLASAAPPPPLHPSHMASTASHTYPHCSQRRPSGSMV